MSDRVSYRVEEIDAGEYAVIRKGTGQIISTGFETYAAAWSWLINRLPRRKKWSDY
jgi:hypothetical protein